MPAARPSTLARSQTADHATQGERLFEFVRASDGASMSCELRASDISGVVVLLLEQGQLFCRAGFPTRDLAIRWAEAERKSLETTPSV